MSLASLPLVLVFDKTEPLPRPSLHLGELKGTSARGGRREGRVWPRGLSVFPNKTEVWKIDFPAPGLGELRAEVSVPFEL